jgi:hypothetical protein
MDTTADNVLLTIILIIVVTLMLVGCLSLIDKFDKNFITIDVRVNKAIAQGKNSFVVYSAVRRVTIK